MAVNSNPQPDAKSESRELKTQGPSSESSFDELADAKDPGIVREFIWFLRYNKKWWMTPILVILLLLVGLAFLTSSPVGPFIYTLF